MMQPEPEPVPAESVGEDDVGAGVDEAAVHLLHQLRLLDIEQFRASPAVEPEGEEGGAHRPVGDEVRAFGKER